MTMNAPDERKQSIVTQFIRYAYGDLRRAGIRFHGSVICPSCHSELCHVLHDDVNRRMLACANCGTRYLDKDQVA